MRIACPSCATTYEVPETRLGPGKMVRCTRCGGEWVPIPDPAEAAATDDYEHAEAQGNTYGDDAMSAAAPAIAAMDRLAAAPARHRSARGLIAAWISTFVVLAAAIAATVVWREPLAHAWPPLARILPVTPHPMPQTAKTTGTKAE